jgi:hypothetical protein
MMSEKELVSKALEAQETEHLTLIEKTCCKELLWQRINPFSLFLDRGNIFIATPKTNCRSGRLTPMIKFCPFCGEEQGND